MVYRYRAYVQPSLRRQMMGHRQVINAFAAERESRNSPSSFRAAVDENSDRPFNAEKCRYIDGSTANDPPPEGRARLSEGVLPVKDEPEKAKMRRAKMRRGSARTAGRKENCIRRVCLLVSSGPFLYDGN
ncbi:MAG: hypothetical protein BJ554DRAFT_8408 [Olpidium bornovanus]|uniref:Uncharacterized protein n=1 Tax=Olpidium bornovanus TaxID=278681 RepID=A0A8H7ZUS3_9FUNG|nr:MAG: hypothetical protein BJ554DRAFT_8408 [Olpidium bornovanus]